MQFKKYILISVVLLSALNILAQSGPKSEAELKETANKLFEEGKFTEAEPMFAQLLALYPKDADYNFKYGASLLAADGDKLKPMKYLKFAASASSVDPRAYYYLGKAYHLNYEFALAVKQYSKFKNKGENEDKEKFEVERQIEMCKNGRNLLSKINDVQVLDKQEISAKDFFRIYDLKGIDGSIITKPQDFMSKYDKKIGDKSIIYLPRNANEVYYSSYGNKGANGKDLFKAVKLGNGNWSDPVSLGAVINTEFDEDFAFIHPDGRTLYFASKGHSSMGGYDLFMSTFDNTTNDWTTPVNLDFAFSSADDDVLFITDEDKNFAFFASNRTNGQGKYTVYKVKVEKEAADVSLIKGLFIADNNPSLKNAKITVIEKETNKTIGVYETDANGNYLVEIDKNGGTYQFIIETTDDAPIHTGIVNVPVQDEFEVLGQELRLVGQGDDQQLVIKNIFDGTAASKTASGPQISSDLIRRKASLDVNLSASEILALETTNSDAISNNSNPTIPDDAQEGSGNNNQTGDIVTTNSAVNTNANNAAPTTPIINKEELTNELDQLYDQLQKDRSALESTANLSFSTAKELKDKADQEFEEYEQKKASNAPKEVLSTSLQKAKETALKSAYAAQLANKIETKKNDLDEKDNQLNITKGLVETNELKLAQRQIQNIKTENESAVNSIDLIQEEKTEINNAIALSNKKKESLANKVNSFESENEDLATKISELEQKIQSGDGDTESLESQIKDYRLDQSDMDYQIQTASKQLANEELNTKALELKLSQLIESESSFASISETSNITALSEQEKSELLNDLKEFQNTDKLAYSVSENSDLNSLADNSSSNQSDLESESPISTNPNNSLNNSTSPVSNLSTTEIDTYYENLINEKQLLSDIEKSSAEQLKVYNDWNQDLEGKMVEKEVSLNTMTDDDERAKVQGEIDGILVRINSNESAIASIEGNLVINEGSQNTSEQGVNSNTASPNAVSQGNPNSNITKPAPTVAVENIDVSAVDESSIIPENYTSLKLKQDYIYGNQEIREGVADAKKSFAEAATYGKKADEARNSAYNLSTIDARNAAFDKAGEYERASKEKQIETAIKFGKVNELEYNKNASLINNSDNYGDDFQSSNLDIANLLANEADLYFNKAQEVRESIVETDRLSKKESSLQKAYDFEMLALSKQDEALKILKVVESEYEINPVTNLYAIDNASAANTASEENSEPAIEIKDAEVMSITSADEASFIADSLNALVSSLQVQKAQINTQIDGENDEDKRLTLEAQIDDISSLQENAKQKIELYELRAKQLTQEKEFTEELESIAKRNVLSPAEVQTLTSSISIDTVNITEDKENQIKNSTVYNQYIENANKRARAIKSAEIAYQSGLELEIEKQRLIKQASVLKSQAAASTDETEKQRLIKEASIIDQKAAQKGASVDSVNNIIKIKNFLISSSDRAMKGTIANLSPLEQAEIQKIANLNVSADPLPGENLADLPTEVIENTGSGNLGSNVNSNETTNPSNLNSTSDNIAPEENTDIPVSDDAVNNETESRTDSNPTNLPNDINSGDDLANNDNTEPTNNTTLDKGAEDINTTENNANTISKPAEPSTANTNTVNSSGNIPDVNNLPRVVKQAIFITLSPKESAYSVDKPIPVNPEMPEGLIYKVQVGAFRNPIPQNLFKGFAPLMAEKIPSGITRYTAGIFLNEKEAVFARNEIRGIGYPDAFVVAFLNGKRIGIAEARKTDSSAEGLADRATSQAGNSGSSNTNSSESSSASNSIPKSAAGTKAALPSEFNSLNVADVVNAETIEGVYYTVQVGVFSKPLIRGEFDQYQPLNVKVLPNGLIRYNSGVFKDAVDANALKEQISKSIGDAFVTAYFNGKRISLAEAARISNRN